MKRSIARVVWNLSEEGVLPPLGSFAPIVFGMMIGCKGKKLPTENKTG